MSDGIQLGAEYKTGRFPVLTSANFTEWLDLAEDVLLSKGLWRYASGDAPEPTDPDGKIAFQKEDAKAVAFLKSAAGSEQRAHLLGIKSSKNVLEKLKAVNQVSQQERVQTLLSQFHGFRALDTIDLSASRLTQLQHEIASADPEERPSDTSKKAVLIQSLPEEYQSTVFALKAAGLSKMSFDDVVQRLKEIETSLRSEVSRIENIARAAKQRPDSVEKAQNGRRSDQPRKGRSGKRNVECYHCHKKGHYQRDCWILNGRLAANQQQQQPPQGAAEHAAVAWRARYQGAFVYQAGHGKPEQQEWILDSGCTQHMTYDEGHFMNYTKDSGVVTLADGKTLQVQGRGTIKVPIQGKETLITSVIHVPKIGFNLLSISQLAERGMKCEFTGGTAVLSRNGAVVATAIRRGMTYALSGALASATHAAHAACVASTEGVAHGRTQSDLWHQRLGHPGKEKTRLIEKAAYEGAPRALKHVADCETCHTTKSTQATSRIPAERATERLGRVHIDFWGPYHEPTIAGRRYMLTVTDDFTRKSWIHLVKDRTEVYVAFRQWQAAAELESGHRVKAIRIDNAPELVKLGEELEKGRNTHRAHCRIHAVAERGSRAVESNADHDSASAARSRRAAGSPIGRGSLHSELPAELDTTQG